MQARKSAEDIENIAAAWLARCEFDGLSQKEQSELDAWLCEAWQHRTAFWRLKAVWTETDRFAAMRRPEREELPAKPRRSTLLSPLRIATAALAVCVLATGGLFAGLRNSEQTISTALGGRQVVELGSGSHAELNTSTVLRVASDDRKAWLDTGEAYFQIKHDAQHPFVVSVAGYRVVDLGTKFVILNQSGRVKIVLLEGRARVEPVSDPAHATTLSPGDVAIATADALSITKEDPQRIAKALGWRHGVLIFEHTSLAEVMAQFNRYNAEKLVIADTDTAKLTVDGTFPVNGVSQFATAAKAVFGVHVERRGNEFVISR
jgi:transmembrane sensor